MAVRRECDVALMSKKEASISLTQAQKAIDTVRLQFPRLSFLVVLGCETRPPAEQAANPAEDGRGQTRTDGYEVRSGAFGALDEIAVMLRDGIPRLLDQLREEAQDAQRLRRADGPTQH